MTKEQWFDVLEQETSDFQDRIDVVDPSPEKWPVYRFELTQFLKKMDEATEVYNMENKGKTNV